LKIKDLPQKKKPEIKKEALTLQREAISQKSLHIGMDDRNWLTEYSEKVTKFIVTSPSKNIKQRLGLNKDK
jgi:hypothetical protein